MKSLKFITLASTLVTPLALAVTSIPDQVNTSVDISSDTYIEVSNVDITVNFPLDKSRHIPKKSKTNFNPPFKAKLSLTRSASAAKSLMSSSPLAPEATNTLSLAPHQINCATAYNLDEDNVYTDTISVVGEQHCYIMPLEQQSKVTGQLLAEDAASNFNLYLYQYDAEKNLLTHVDSSEKAAGTAEAVYAVLPQASYILVAELMSGAGGSISFIGNSYSSYDSFEPNDSDILTKIPAVTVGQVLTGNLDNPEDVDYFSFKLNNTETELKININGSEEHQVEFFNAGAWQVLPHNQALSAKGDAGATYYMRALAKPNTPTSALNNYQIKTSNAFNTFVDYNVWTTDQNLTDLVHYFHTEAYSNLSAGGKVVDVNGAPVIGERMAVSTIVNGTQVDKIGTTNAAGQFSVSFDLPRCTGDIYSEEKASNFGTPRDIWSIKYKLAQDIQIYPLSKRDDNDIRTLKYIHICDETFIETIRR
jgi:hypothetical protein